MRPAAILPAGLAAGLAFSGLLLASCSVAPPPVGSLALARQPSAHLAADPYLPIAEAVSTSLIHRACATGPARPGPFANLDASLIPSDEYLQHGRRAEALIEPYRFAIPLTKGPNAGWTLDVTVPAGFVTDLHSKPGWSEQLTLKTRLALEAAVIHDWLYAVGAPGDDDARALADQAYGDILAFYGVEGFTHWSVTRAVRLSGDKHFGDPAELRFYNKCFYGLCEADPGVRPGLRTSPVMPLDADPALRQRLWALTVCLEPPASAPISVSAGLSSGKPGQGHMKER